MRRLRIALLFALGLIVMAMGASTRADEEQLLVIAHPGVAIDSIDGDTLAAIFTHARRRWPSGDEVIAVNLEPNTPARVYFDRVVLDMTPLQAARYWIDKRIRDGGTAPLKAPTPAMMVKVVASLARSIGYVPASQPIAGVKIVARVTQGHVVPERRGPAR